MLTKKKGTKLAEHIKSRSYSFTDTLENILKQRGFNLGAGRKVQLSNSPREQPPFPALPEKGIRSEGKISLLRHEKLKPASSFYYENMCSRSKNGNHKAGGNLRKRIDGGCPSIGLGRARKEIG